jgi:hypothetical protein
MSSEMEKPLGISEPIAGADTAILSSADTGIGLDATSKGEKLPELPRHKVIMETNPSLEKTKYLNRAEQVDDLFTGKLRPSSYKAFLNKLEPEVKNQFPDTGNVKVLDAYFNERARADLASVFRELQTGKSIDALFQDARAAKGSDKQDKLRALETFGARLLHVKAPENAEKWQAMGQSNQVAARLAERIVLEVEMAIVDTKLENKSLTSKQAAVFRKHFEGYQKNLDISDRFRKALAIRAGLLAPKPVDGYEVSKPIESTARRPAFNLPEETHNRAYYIEGSPQEKRQWVEHILSGEEVPVQLTDKLEQMVTATGGEERELRFIKHLGNQMKYTAIRREAKPTFWRQFFTPNALLTFNHFFEKLDARREVLGWGGALKAALSYKQAKVADAELARIRQLVAAKITTVAKTAKEPRAEAQFTYMARWLQKK